MTLRIRLAIAVGAGKTLQSASQAFWKQSSFTYLASPEYYDRRERILRELLPSIPSPERVIDVGCGDGRYTCLFAQFASSVIGYDLSPSLVDQARKRGQAAGLKNLQVAVCDLDDIPLNHQADLVACMGVTPCLVDESKYLRLLDRLVRLVRPTGRLLMVDSMTTGPARSKAFDNGYVAQYRNVANYRQRLRDRGFEIEKEIVIQEWEQITNRLLLLTRIITADGIR